MRLLSLAFAASTPHLRPSVSRRMSSGSSTRRSPWACAPPSKGPRRRAAALVIGNEILNGSTLDTNTQTLAKFLFARGVTLARTETIPDDASTITKTTARLAAQHDYVFTSGGIGPTLDDITYASVAAAFGVPVAPHPPTLARMREISPDMELNAARRRMAALPAGCHVHWTAGLWVPTAVLGGGKVFVLPGVPRLFREMLHALPPAAVSSGAGVAPRATAEVRTTLSEGRVSALLDAVAAAHARVELGSYPVDPVATPGAAHRTRLALIGDDGGEVAAAEKELRGLVETEEAAWEKVKAARA